MVLFLFNLYPNLLHNLILVNNYLYPFPMSAVKALFNHKVH
jgi:hypothetical protein